MPKNTRKVLIYRANEALAARPFNPQQDARMTVVETIRLGVPLVYCVRRTPDSSIVKIGTSRNVIDRLRKLNVPFDDVLCLTRGDRQYEAMLRFLFNPSRVVVRGLPGEGDTEHFNMSPQIAAWINKCREAMGVEPLDLL